jgi:hypothetical protein
LGLISWLILQLVGLIISLLFSSRQNSVPDNINIRYLIDNINIRYLIVLLAFGLIGGIVFGMITGLKKDLKVRSRPNQGIWNSLQSQMWTTAVIFLFMILLFAAFSWLQNWIGGLLISLFIGFAVGGGKACLQHLSLRIVLWQSGLPWNFARFLNYCVERRLLLRVGGSYRFLHRELLDHFAQSNR